MLADALSRAPLSESNNPVVVAAIQHDSKSREGSLGARQRNDQGLREVIQYLETGSLPLEQNRARELVLSASCWRESCVTWRGTKL